MEFKGFEQGHHDWQAEIAGSDVCRARLIRIPIRLGRAELGPFRLAYLEALLRIADRRVSAKEAADG